MQKVLAFKEVNSTSTKFFKVCEHDIARLGLGEIKLFNIQITKNNIHYDSKHGKVKGKNHNLFFVLNVRSWVALEITRKTCLYNFDPLKLQFYIVKLGFTRVYIIFLISAW